MVIAYVPQHYRIIINGSSEGLSPVFLLLGVTSATSGTLNMFVMQWGTIRCCRFLSLGSCIEMTAAVIQLALDWVMFSLILVLYIVYFPPHLKYVAANINYDESRPLLLPSLKRWTKKTKSWEISIAVSWLAAAHLLMTSLTTGFILFAFSPTISPLPNPSPSPTPIPPQSLYDGSVPFPVAQWATFLGVSAALFAAIQFIPQIIHTFRLRLVGALSIPTLCIQIPQSLLTVLSIALRPGTNWTSCAPFAVAGIMQGTLLIMCICLKVRQKRLGLDDFGKSLWETPSSRLYL
ncbi:hypothetical protein J3R30DRAFT_3403971 [Lentinula aciculospora]|uniref:Uncharacterized protein n=1 Tax=Lentinula aciculospora TaxID=153920 RepID=A0A9W9ABR7_9AGAR|nr:hypothetical protein J3R30DRAFT_3403971 [Lentinula aciculospora]